MQEINDDRITRSVNSKLATRGFGSQSKLTVQTSKGLVTLTGSVQHAHQKRTAVKAISGIAGIRRIIDQLTIKPATKR